MVGRGCPRHRTYRHLRRSEDGHCRCGRQSRAGRGVPCRGEDTATYRFCRFPRRTRCQGAGRGRRFGCGHRSRGLRPCPQGFGAAGHRHVFALLRRIAVGSGRHRITNHLRGVSFRRERPVRFRGWAESRKQANDKICLFGARLIRTLPLLCSGLGRLRFGNARIRIRHCAHLALPLACAQVTPSRQNRTFGLLLLSTFRIFDSVLDTSASGMLK